MNDKKHWYDGLFYDKLIAPNQDRMFGEIKKIINADCRILDVGCGTGRLAFQLSNYCSKVVGIDLSSKNIGVANGNLNGKFSNIEFLHGDAGIVRERISEKFDYAVITYVIHEMPESERVKVLTELKKVADKIIIGDYLTPTPKSLWGGLNVVVEYLAKLCKKWRNRFSN